LKTKLSITFLLFVIAKSMLSQTVYFNRWYDFNGWGDIGGSIIVTGNNYCWLTTTATPYQRDYQLLELDSLGDSIKLKRFSQIPYQFYMVDLINNQQGNYAVFGTKVNDSTLDYQIAFDEYDQNFDTINTHEYGDTVYKEQGQTIIPVSNGGYLATGFIDKTQQNLGVKTYLLRLDELGNIKWWQIYDHGLNYWETGTDIVEAEDAGFYLCGYRLNALTGDRDILLIRTDSLGNELWEKTYGGDYNDYGGYIVKSLEGGYLISGIKVTSTLPNIQIDYGWLIKIDTFGNIEWDKQYGYNINKRNGFWTGLMQLPDSSYVALGTTRYSKDQGWIVKTDRFGNVIWSRTYTRNPSKHHYFYDFKPTPDGGFIVCGTTWNQSQDAWLVKLDSFGCDTPGCQLNDPVPPLPPLPPSFRLWPNPTRDHILITLPDSSLEADIKLFDALGRQIYAKHEGIESHKLLFNMAPFPPGLYILQVKTTFEVYTGKIMRK